MSNLVLDDFLVEIGPEEMDDSFCVGYEIFVEDCETAKERLYEIYKECLMTDEEVKKDSIEDLVVGNGFLSDVCFSADRLRKNCDSIISVVDTLYYTEDCTDPFSFMDCGTVAYDDERLRAYVDEDAELLVRLGTAIGEISIMQMPSQFEDEGTLYAMRRNINIEEDCKVFCK